MSDPPESALPALEPPAQPPDRYPLPLYLNQKYVFDVLSMMEGALGRPTSRVPGTGARSSTPLARR